MAECLQVGEQLATGVAKVGGKKRNPRSSNFETISS